jgi:hypothetical protein
MTAITLSAFGGATLVVVDDGEGKADDFQVAEAGVPGHWSYCTLLDAAKKYVEVSGLPWAITGPN